MLNASTPDLPADGGTQELAPGASTLRRALTARHGSIVPVAVLRPRIGRFAATYRPCIGHVPATYRPRIGRALARLAGGEPAAPGYPDRRRTNAFSSSTAAKAAVEATRTIASCGASRASVTKIGCSAGT
jgi:hypothetical protein